MPPGWREGNSSDLNRCLLRRPAGNWFPASASKRSGGSPARAPTRALAIRVGVAAAPCTPRRGHRTRRSDMRVCALCCRSDIRAAHWACPRICRPHRTSTRDKRTSSRILRCVPKKGWLAGAGRLRPISRRDRWCPEKQLSLPRAAEAEREDSRESALSEGNKAGSQNRRKYSPAGVPASVWVSSSFSSRESMPPPSRRKTKRRFAKPLLHPPVGTPPPGHEPYARPRAAALPLRARLNPAHSPERSR